MFDDVVLGSEFFERLLKVDAQITAEVRRAGCPRCAGPLHRSDYTRKPRLGRGVTIGDAQTRRFSLCCGREGCRRRATPPSLRFLGRRVYLEVVVMVATVVGMAFARAAAVRSVTGVPARTVTRWQSWWSGPFSATGVFAEICARFVGLEARTAPRSFLDRMDGSAQERIALASSWLAPLTTKSVDGARFLRAMGSDC